MLLKELVSGIDAYQTPPNEKKVPKLSIEPALLAKLLQWAHSPTVTGDQINNLVNNIKVSVDGGRSLSVVDYDRIVQGFNAQDGAQKSPAPMAYGDYKSTNPTRTIPYTNFSSYIS